MIPELATLLLYLALISSLISSALYISSPDKPNVWMLRLVFVSFFLVLGSFLMLIYSFVISDFSVLNVFYNSHESKPLIYKISGAWGNHEGSMMLWLTAMNGFTMFFALFSRGEQKLINNTILIQNLLSALFLFFVIFTSNPFERIFPAPEQGLGLNPILQDIGLAFHPPMLYMGYVGFSLAFSAAISALIEGKLNQGWVKIVRPWVTISWTFLTIGIGLGSWWAYRELGWGGYWFWDPVENASLMPWLAATALIHSLIVTDRIGQFKISTLALAILTFCLSLVGTFIVRSGLITSVHSFAHDPKRGMFILGIIGALITASLALYIFRAHKISYQPKQFSFLSKPIFILFNNLMLVVAVSIVLIGTLYPLILELFTGDKISVGAPYFNSLIGPLAVIALIFCTIGTDLSWRGSNGFSLLKKHLLPLSSAMTLTALIFWHWEVAWNTFYFLGINFSLWLILHLTLIIYKLKPKIISGYYAMYLAHCGFAILVMSVIMNFALIKEMEKPIKHNEIITLENFKLKFNGINYSKHENYVSRVGIFEVLLPNNRQIYLYPETRLFPVEKQQTTEAAIFSHMLYDLYITIGEIDSEERIMVRASIRPMISWIWFSCILIAFGGINGLIIQIIQLLNDRNKSLYSKTPKGQ